MLRYGFVQKQKKLRPKRIAASMQGVRCLLTGLCYFIYLLIYVLCASVRLLNSVQSSAAEAQKSEQSQYIWNKGHYIATDSIIQNSAEKLWL